MNGLMGLGLLGWLTSLVAGFVIGGIYFLSIKLQVEYVVEKRGPLWLMPAALYARLLLVAIVLVAVALKVPGRRIPAVMLAGVGAAFLARIMVARLVRRRDAAKSGGDVSTAPGVPDSGTGAEHSHSIRGGSPGARPPMEP